MSSYMHFFVKSKNNDFVPIGCYCRCSAIYSAFNENYGVPYEKITPLTISRLNEMKSDLYSEIERENDSIIRENEIFTTKINCIKNLNKELDEIDDYFNELITNHYSYLDEIKEIIEENKTAINFINFLQEIIENVQWEDEYNIDEFVYVGIECGDNVTLEDID